MLNQALFARLLVEDEDTVGELAEPFASILEGPGVRARLESRLSDGVDAELRGRARNRRGQFLCSKAQV